MLAIDKLVNFTQGGSASDKAVDTIKLLSWQFNMRNTFVTLLCYGTHDTVLNDLFTNYFRIKSKSSLVLPTLQVNHPI